MKNCCGPFKRGQTAKAVNPNQQCFVDCCGKLCPPDGCCDSVKVEFECGCACKCDPQTYSFGGLKFRRKKRKNKFGLPSFSQKTLAANGFTFAVGGTIPSSSSSSSSDKWLCVELICAECPWYWNGSTCVDGLPHPAGAQRYHTKDECLCDKWNNGAPAGPLFEACCRTNPGFHPNCPGFFWSGDLLSLAAADCNRICILESTYDATKHVKAGGPYDTKEECENNCCGSSSSSSSSCECKNMEVTITTDACCLYVSGDSIEAVGSGTVTASVDGPDLQGCEVTVKLNGSVDPITVEDGEAISVDVTATGECKCCEVAQNCQSASSTSLWVQKSNVDKRTIALNKKELVDKVRFATKKVRGRRPKNP
jgi:hypothetical protein